MFAIAECYRAAQQQFADLISGLSSDDLQRPVPACPGWTVRDVVSHVTGVADDITNLRVEGAATEAWTAAQIERNREQGVTELLERWAAQLDGVAETLEAVQERRPPIDCLTHEFDVRGALGRGDGRSSALLRTLSGAVLRAYEPVIPLLVRSSFADPSFGHPSFVDEVELGPSEGSPTELDVDGFELFRSRLGRRSVDQVRAFAWSGDAEPFLVDWFLFGPATGDLVE